MTSVMARSNSDWGGDCGCCCCGCGGGGWDDDDDDDDDGWDALMVRGMGGSSSLPSFPGMPAQAGISGETRLVPPHEMPACAGMTAEEGM